MLLAIHNENSAILSESGIVIKSKVNLKLFNKNKYPEKKCRHNIHTHVFETAEYF